jgi:hypothetical protein
MAVVATRKASATKSEHREWELQIQDGGGGHIGVTKLQYIGHLWTDFVET